MILDALQAAVMTAAGLLAMRAAGVRNPFLRYGLAPLVGTAILVVLGVGLGVVTLRFIPAVIFAFTLIVPVVIYLLVRRTGGGTRLDPLRDAGAVLVGAVAGVACAAFARVTYHADSFEYLTIATQLVEGTFLEAISYFQLEKRMFAVGTLHANAISAGESYSVGAMPFLAFSLLLAIAVLLLTGLRSRGMQPAQSWLVSLTAVLALTVMNRFVWNAFYINGHLLFAALLVGIVGLSWLRALSAIEASRYGVTAVQCVLVAALVLTRPDAAFTALLAIVPTIADTSITRRERGALIVAVGAPLLAWEGFVLLVGRRLGADPTISMIGLAVLGAVLLLAPLVLRWNWLFRRPVVLVAVAEGALWLALAALAIRRPDVLIDSLVAFMSNVVLSDGSWGPSIVLLMVITALAIMTLRSPERIHLRFALTSFIPLVFVLAYLRDSPYRIAEADSLNRMVIQVVPLMVVVIAASAIGSWRRRRDPVELSEPR